MNFVGDVGEIRSKIFNYEVRMWCKVKKVKYFGINWEGVKDYKVNILSNLGDIF